MATPTLPTPARADAHAHHASARPWRETLSADATAGFLVFLLALPLCLGIALASHFPPTAGILTAIVAGLLSSFLGSAPLTIKGPAAGLIVIAAGAVDELGAGNAEAGYRYALAAIVVAAVAQIAFGLLRAGRVATMLPTSAVHGMLAAIGLIIASKQAHVLLGVAPHAKSPLALLLEIPHSVLHANPEVALIGGVSLAVMFLWGRVAPGRLKKLPAPLVVLALAVPMGMYFDLEHEHTYTFGGVRDHVGPWCLVTLRGSLASAVALPDFSRIVTGASLKFIAMFALIGTLESVLSARAVDMLDPAHRRSNLDRDTVSVGVGNLVAGMLGGLPMISEIVRSSANVSNGARTHRSNFFHGLFLLLFVVLAPGLIHRIPMASLAAMLTYTGYRLASPVEFAKTYRVGREQLFVFTGTVVLTLATDLLIGVAGGIALKVLVHLSRGVSLRSLVTLPVELERTDERVTLCVKGPLLFSNVRRLDQAVRAHPTARHIVIDLSASRLVDHTSMERLHELEGDLSREGVCLDVEGLTQHRAASAHPLSARTLVAPAHPA